MPSFFCSSICLCTISASSGWRLSSGERISFIGCRSLRISSYSSATPIAPSRILKPGAPERVLKSEINLPSTPSTATFASFACPYRWSTISLSLKGCAAEKVATLPTTSSFSLGEFFRFEVFELDGNPPSQCVLCRRPRGQQEGRRGNPRCTCRTRGSPRASTGAWRSGSAGGVDPHPSRRLGPGGHCLFRQARS